MSFSSDVKAELVKLVPNEEHCRIAELSALVKHYVKIELNDGISMLFSGENSAAQKKCFTLLSKTFNITLVKMHDTGQKAKESYILTQKDADLSRILERLSIDNPMSLLDRDCCIRAYLRGFFLASGFVGDPQKAYHFEMLTDEEEFARLLTYLLSQFNISAKHFLRKKYNVTYIKESEAISDVLSVLGAYKSMMGLANTRIEKDVRNTANRRYNCDLANVSRSMDAASKQIEDIRFIQNKVGLDALPDSLREMAIVRVEFPEESFADLGNRLSPPVGKSGVNHRLRKISEFAENLRGEKENK